MKLNHRTKFWKWLLRCCIIQLSIKVDKVQWIKVKVFLQENVFQNDVSKTQRHFIQDSMYQSENDCWVWRMELFNSINAKPHDLKFRRSDFRLQCFQRWRSILQDKIFFTPGSGIIESNNAFRINEYELINDPDIPLFAMIESDQTNGYETCTVSPKQFAHNMLINVVVLYFVTVIYIIPCRFM